MSLTLVVVALLAVVVGTDATHGLDPAGWHLYAPSLEYFLEQHRDKHCEEPVQKLHNCFRGAFTGRVVVILLVVVMGQAFKFAGWQRSKPSDDLRLEQHRDAHWDEKVQRLQGPKRTTAFRGSSATAGTVVVIAGTFSSAGVSIT